ncbi:DNA-directed DNA polymerase [Tanacetum coccineum]
MLRNCHGHNLTNGNIIKIFYHSLNETTQEAIIAAAGGIYLYKTPNRAYQLLEDKVLLKLDWAKNQKPKTSLKKTVPFADEGSSNSNIDKSMARMDAMAIKMNAQYKEIQSRAKCNHCGGNIMDGVDIENLTIEQYLELIKENHAPSVGIKVDDITIAEYLEYEETIKTQDYDDYQPHLAKDDLGGQTREKTITEEQEDPEKCGETKTRAIIGAMVNKLREEWFSGGSRDMDDLDGIIDYLEPILYDGFIDNNNEAYKRRKNKLLGMPYTEPPPIVKEEAKITGYNLGAGEVNLDNSTNNVLIPLDSWTSGLLVYKLPLSRAASELRPYHFTYPERKLTMEEMLYKFIDEGKREHEEMRAFICDFQTTNEILFKEINNSLIELRFGVQELLKIKEGKRKSSAEEVFRKPEAAPQNLPFIETLSQMPKYAKFLKGLLTNKARLEEACTITMNERCSAVLLNKLPSKEKDPGSFTIPYDIGQLHIDNALADLGASISLMPYTMYEKLGLGEPKATRMSLELADRSIQYPRGIIENVLIKVDKFVLLIDFVILDMPEDSRVPIILGRPFLATARAMIDVFNKKITLRVGDDEVIFDVDQSIKRQPTEDDECYGIDDLDDTNNAETQELLANNKPDSNDSNKPIRRIASINTPYSVDQETAKPVKLEREHLYSASANEIDEKKPELKDLPNHLEYAYLHGDKSFPIIISSELSDKEKSLLLQVLEKGKGAIA